MIKRNRINIGPYFASLDNDYGPYFASLHIAEPDFQVDDEVQSTNCYEGKFYRNKDIKGVITKLDYIKNIGTVAHIKTKNGIRLVDVKWLEYTPRDENIRRAVEEL